MRIDCSNLRVKSNRGDEQLATAGPNESSQFARPFSAASSIAFMATGLNVRSTCGRKPGIVSKDEEEKDKSDAPGTEKYLVQTAAAGDPCLSPLRVHGVARWPQRCAACDDAKVLHEWLYVGPT